MSFYKDLWNELRKNKGALLGLGVISFFIFISIFAPLLAPQSPFDIQDGALRLPPFSNLNGVRFFLGSDDLGRDVLSRLIYGARVSMSVGFSIVLLSTTIGTTLGLLAGYFGGWVDRVIMRAMDLIMALPMILFAIVIVTVLGPGILNSILAVTIVILPNFARLIRGQVLAERDKPYVAAARLYGASDLRLMFKEILPNCLAPLIVQATLGFSDGILNCAALGFLGLGAQAPMPEWGAMLSDARSFIESSPWLVSFPGVCILICVLSFNILGDGLRDALDPKLRKQGS